MIKKKVTLRMLRLTVLCILQAGCNREPHSSDLIGSWEENVERKNGSALIQVWQFASKGEMTVAGTGATQTLKARWYYEGHWELNGSYLYVLQSTSTWVGVANMNDGTKQQLPPEFGMDRENIGKGLRVTLVDKNRLKVRYPSSLEYIWVRANENITGTKCSASR